MTTSREHRMAFGSVLLPSGAVRFGLWAPGAEKISLCLEQNGKKRFLPMPRREQGWFHLETKDPAGAVDIASNLPSA